MKNKIALIGSTGFIGSFLKNAMDISDTFHSKNIQDIKNRHFEMIVCAGLPAAKWLANKDPAQDKANMEALKKVLQTVRANRFVLISTVDVFKRPKDVDELTNPSIQDLHPYGLHRLEFENFISTHFLKPTILRLPAVYGPGLRKNALYDLINDNALDLVPRRGIFQWYNLRQLPRDIERSERYSLVHLVPEPVSMQQIINLFFSDKIQVGHEREAAHYDLKTLYAEQFDGKNGYITDADTVLQQLGEWISVEKSKMVQ